MSPPRTPSHAGRALAGLALAACLVVLAAPALRADTPPTPEERALVEKYVMPLPTKVQVAVALVRGDSVRFLGVERTKEGLRYLDNRAALFEIGSITKVFTATLLAQQVKKGVIRLDEPVRGMVPFALKAPGRDGVDVTLAHLVSHSSGMCHQPPGLNLHAILHLHAREPFRDYDRERFERYLRREMALAFTPGTKYSYSNMGMSLAAYALSRRTGKGYEAMLQEGVFDPLVMRSSFVGPARGRPGVVPGVEKEGAAAPSWDMAALNPSGGIKTSAADFARFVQAQFGDDPAIRLAQEPRVKIEDGYWVGMGWHIIDRKNGERWLNHGGGMAGYTAIVNVNVRRKRAVVALSNLGNAHKRAGNVDQLGRELLKGLEAQP